MDHVPSQQQHDAHVRSADRAVLNRRTALLVLLASATVAFSALGVWQVERRAWKLDLVRRVESLIHAPAVPMTPNLWTAGGPAEYRRVRLTGRYGKGADSCVQALSELGAGYWVLTPLVTDTRSILVNRGWIPREAGGPRRCAIPRPNGTVTVTGLLRRSEPGGGFLRVNDPASDRWYSRDVVAIARARGIGPVAPVFVDADAAPAAPGQPIGGLTVVRFRNNHLVYALTWFALAGMAFAGFAMLLRERWR